ncbi:hypothetical protein CL620_03710 [archaeon]|nr:hypothetical protein [archaeon]
MKKVVLENGLTILFEHKEGNAVVVEIMVNVGSNDEKPDERGLSHFLEHMLFEGTTKRPTNHLISNEIESLGGEFNAYTTNERTNYYVKIVKKHFGKAIEILGDILQHSEFKQEFIDKEKKVVLKEIDMADDEPRYFQWLLFHKTLFTKHPAGNATHGDRKIVTNLSKEKTMAYFHKHYTPANMTIAIVGDVTNWKNIVKEHFGAMQGSAPRRKKVREPVKKRSVVKKARKNITSTYMILGFLTQSQPHPDTFPLEVINGILGRGQSGRMFTEIRSKRALAYEVGTEHVAERSFGYFTIYASVDKKNVKTTKKVVLEELRKLQHVTTKDLKEAKDYLEGEFLLEIDDTQKRSSQLLFWEQVGDANKMNEYVRKIRKVSVADVKRVAKKYFKNHVMIVVEGK